MKTVCITAQSGAAGYEGMSVLIMMVALFDIMWFLMIIPQQKKQMEIQKFQNALSEGQQVVTGGGIYGTVKKIDLASGIVEIEIAKGVVIRVDKAYVFKDTQSTQVAAK